MAERTCTSLVNPFPGLRPFGPGDAHLLFGRDAGIREVTEKLCQKKFVAVIGASGSGKSSLVFSGIIPHLLAENCEGKRSWSYLVLRPSNNPVDTLADGLSSFSEAAGFTYISPMAASITLHNDSRGLADIIGKIRKNLRQQILLVVDQFEEIFRYNTESDKEGNNNELYDFVNLLVSAVNDSDSGLYIILTMQSDFIPECSRFESLVSLMNSGNYIVPQIKGEGFSEIIEEPLKISGTPIDGKLVKTIILEAGNKAGQLPQMQHMLMRLWDQWNKKGDTPRSIGISDYDAIGRFEGALSDHAGIAYNALSDDHKYACERLFRTITTTGRDKKGKRKPERLAYIQAATGCPMEDIVYVADIFRASEYSLITPGAGINLTPESIIDISHESIINSWDLLRQWVEDEEEAQKLYRRLACSAARHQEGTEMLWVPPDLTLAVNWRDKLKPTIEWAERIDPAYERTMLFLESSEEEFIASEAQKENELKKTIHWTKVLGIVFCCFTLLSITLIGNYLSVKAKALKREALALAQKESVMAENRQLSDSLDVTVLGKRAVEAEAEVARKLASIAELKANDATLQKSIAFKAMEEANSRAGEESRKRMLSVGKSLAVRSATIQNDNDLQSVVAYQGYLFNQHYGGFRNDADIFNALYIIGKKTGNRFCSATQTGLDKFTALTISSDGKYLFGSDRKGNIYKWQGNRPEQRSDVMLSGSRIFKSLAVSPDGKWLACGTNNEDIVLLPVDINARSYELNGEGSAAINALVYSSDGKILFASTSDGKIAEWHFDTHIQKSFRIAGVDVKNMGISADNRMLAVLSSDGRAIIVPVDFSSSPKVISETEERITALCFVPWKKQLIMGNDEGFIELWDMDKGRDVEIIEGHKGGVKAIAVCSDSRQIASAGDDLTIKLWEAENMLQPPVTFTDNQNILSFIGYTPEGRSLLSVSDDGIISQRPAQIEYLAGSICTNVNRNMSPEEWEAFVGNDIPYQKTCEGKSYKIKATQISSAE